MLNSMRLASWRLYFRRRPQTIGLVVMMTLLLTMLLLLSSSQPSSSSQSFSTNNYQFQQTYHKYTARSKVYNISIIADKDKDSKSAGGWGSVLLNGRLSRDEEGLYDVQWDDPIPLHSKINEDGRGMELSDLTYYDNRLLSFDDRTGIVYEIDAENEQAIARHILVDGNGRNSKGFKCEWSTVKDGVLYVGGLGKEWTTPEGEIKSSDPQYVKRIDSEGRINHVSWIDVYTRLREATGYQHPGYLIHEAVRFNPISRRWFFLPRRASTKTYDDALDETRGANIVITTNEHFEDIKKFHIGTLVPSHGFSAFVFVPHREDEIIALKTEEVEGKIATYITAFDLETQTELMTETKIADIKFEGIEFV